MLRGESLGTRLEGSSWGIKTTSLYISLCCINCHNTISVFTVLQMLYSEIIPLVQSKLDRNYPFSMNVFLLMPLHALSRK